MEHEVRREIVLPAPPDEVWDALTDPERLAEWFANDVDLDLRPGGEGVFRWDDGARRRAVVEIVEERHRFSFDWFDDEDGPATSVDFTLEEVPDGTRLTVVESAPTGLRASSAEWGWALELQAVGLSVAA